MNSASNNPTNTYPMPLTFTFPLQPINCQETGPANLAEQTFRGDIYASIAREAIQNSLDASHDNGKPVKVKFAYKFVNLENDSVFNEILNSAEMHIRLCEDKYRDRPQQQEGFTKMLNDIARFRRLNRLPYLEISDYETIGMYYDINTPDRGRMCSFMHEDGEHYGKGNNGGGANGIGKTAYFAMSPLRMVLASTFAIPSQGSNSEDAKPFFSGSMKLVTHPNPEDNTTKFQYAGYIPEIPDNIAFKPLTDTSDLPFRLSRKPNINNAEELGTSFFIIGCEPDGIKYDIHNEDYDSKFEECSIKAYNNCFLPSILRNYFVAIKRNKLKVQLGDQRRANGQVLDPIIINKDNLETSINKIFKESNSVRVAKVKESLNPRHFIKSIGEEGGTDEDEQKIRHFELNLDKIPELQNLRPTNKSWGTVCLYLNIDQQLNDNMIVTMRSPLMSVSKWKTENNRGQFAGILIADEEGNYCDQVLRACEPADHASWKETNADSLGHGESRETANILLNTIKEWMEETIEKLFPQNNSNDVYEGMRNYLPLYNSDDPSQRNPELNKRADVLEKETTKISVVKSGIKNKNKGSKVSGKKDITGIYGDGDDYTGGAGGDGGGNKPGTTNPTRPVIEDEKGKNMIVAKEIPVRFRSFAKFIENENCWEHILVLSGVKEDFSSIDLALKSQGESNVESLKVGSAKYEDGTPLQVKDATIKGIQLKAGETKRLRVRFLLSSTPYSLRAVSTVQISLEKKDENYPSVTE